ncbi:bystin [Quercus suber]|uniref:Bystin n=1 Tax=Quercus suber TaxID=58331 RepID=A0AAW0KLL4_QUESU
MEGDKCCIIETCKDELLWYTTSFFIKLLLEKKYALPYRVLDATVAHFMRFLEDSRMMPVIWHQSLLAFVQRYKNELRKEDKDNLRNLLEKQRHKLVTPEVLRELNNSRNRGEKEDDLMALTWVPKEVTLYVLLREMQSHAF